LPADCGPERPAVGGRKQQEEDKAMAIYMKIAGSKPIDGPVTTKGFSGQIELTAFDLDANRAVSMASKSEQRRTHAEAALEEVHVRKMWDAMSSSKLFQAVMVGTADFKVTITFTSADDGSPLNYLVVELDNVTFSHYDIRATGKEGSQPEETLTLNFTSITMSPSTVNSDKKPAAGSRVSHDATTGVTT
jgi:type VI protein secretion system component Hcp